MRYLHLDADATGESHWREVDVALRERSFAPPAERILVSDGEPATALLFLRLAAGWDEPSHPTPRRQTLVGLRGTVRVTASDGEVRDIGPGDVWRMEDVTGKSHQTRVVAADDFEAAVVQHD